MPTTTFPAWLKDGLVLGKSLVVDSDTDVDVDTAPDATYPEGSTLVFTPSVDTLVCPTHHTTVYPQQVTATINATGDPVTEDGDPLYLVANVGQTDNDQVWHWTVQPIIVYNGKSIRVRPFGFDVTADVSNYLSDQQPIPAATPSSVVVRGPAGAGAPPSGTTDGFIAASTASSTEWVDPAPIVRGIGDGAYPQLANNLSDVPNKATARGNLGLGTASTHPAGDFATPADLSDYVPGTRQVNGHALTADLTLTAADVSAIPTSQKAAASGVASLDGSTKVPIAQVPTGTSSSTVAIGNDSRITGAAQKASNLSDLASASTARTNLGLGTAATHAATDFVAYAPVPSGDATGATDTAAMNTLLAALGVAGGGVLLAPNGAFWVTQIVIPGNCVLRGSGRNATILQQVSGTASSIITNKTPGSDRHVGVEDLCATAFFNQTANTGGVVLVGSRDSWVRRNQITYTNGACVQWIGFGAGGTGDSMYGDISENVLQNVVSGNYIQLTVGASGSKPDGARIRGNHLNGAAGVGIKIDPAASGQQGTGWVRITENTIEGVPTPWDVAGQGIYLTHNASEVVSGTMTINASAGPASYPTQVVTYIGNVYATYGAPDALTFNDNTSDGVIRFNENVGGGATHSTRFFGPNIRAQFLRPTAARVETFDRNTEVNNNTYSLPTGTLVLTALALPSRFTVSNLAFMSAGAVTPAGVTHWWYGLFDTSRSLLAITADQGSATWTTSQPNSLAIANIASGAASSFVTKYTGLYYVGMVMVATTTPNMYGNAAPNAAPTNLLPILRGTSSTGQTTPPSFPFTAAAITGTLNGLYAQVS